MAYSPRLPAYPTFFVRDQRDSTLGALLVLAWLLSWPGVSLAQLDICGCIGHPESLGAFDASNAATYPPGTSKSGSIVTIPLPDSGRLIFTSFTIPQSLTVLFTANRANTPVMLLVSGDVTFGNNSTLDVSGGNGSTGSSVENQGGSGGPGGFPGGNGAYHYMNFARIGGAGLGPGGGTGGKDSPLTPGGPGAFVSTPELLSLVGGGGGGGGASALASNELNCSGASGGGGGGALLIAANGTITITSSTSGFGNIVANGGRGGIGNNTCSSAGGAGSGGAIRLIANTITGNGRLFALGNVGSGPNNGVIRLEAFTNTLPSGNTNPLASRTPAPGPLMNPLTPTVEVTAVGGKTFTVPPQGVFGGVDVTLPAPGAVSIALATSGVPNGTIVQMTVKPRVGGGPILESVTLTDCNSAGDCAATVVVNIPAGRSVIEAQATFQTP